MTLLLYTATVLIWGSTWILIKFQLNGTAEEVSVGMRFILAAVVLFGIAALRGRRLTIAREFWGMVAVQGALMFCLNYLLVYPTGCSWCPGT
ncbi:MAG: EamA family transporter, partial [Pseudomonadota bacterium]